MVIAINYIHTQNIFIAFIQRLPNVFDVGPAMYKCYTNILCLLGTNFTQGLKEYHHWDTFSQVSSSRLGGELNV